MPDREKLSDDFFVAPKERDAISIVRDASRRVLPKRFYKAASVDERDGGFAVLLDGRPMRTPKQMPLVLPTRASAQLVAAEWQAQGDEINPASMPVTRLVNSALDGVADHLDETLADIVRYAGSDLLCYRAGEPPALVAAQAAAWDPLLAFAREKFGARMNVAEGLTFVEQPQDSLAAIANAVERIAREPHAVLRAAALHSVTTLTGSAIIALAVLRGAINTQDAWTAAHVDEDEQMRVWGIDTEALRRRAGRLEDMKAACDLLAALAG
jgi:chaperone required for assembly of F1-ATPase